jgi:hypothetical protein
MSDEKRTFKVRAMWVFDEENFSGAAPFSKMKINSTRQNIWDMPFTMPRGL